MYRGFMSIIMIGIFVCSARTQTKQIVPYYVQPGSRLWIEGSATLGSYTCETVAVYGTGALKSDVARLIENAAAHSAEQHQIQVFVDVKMFDCGNPAMNSDMYHALRAEEDSAIEYTLTNANVVYDSIQQTGWLGLQTIGTLMIAGVSRTDTIFVQAKSLSQMKYEIVGSKNLSMLDFKIVPPTAFFGLIRANEKLVVKFDIIAGPDPSFTESRMRGK